MKTIYVCSPYRGDVKKHKQYARQLTAAALDAGFAPITPHLYMTECLDDDLTTDRAKGLSAALTVLERCDALIYGSDLGISEGMTAEIDFAFKKSIPVFWAKKVRKNKHPSKRVFVPVTYSDWTMRDARIVVGTIISPDGSLKRGTIVFTNAAREERR